MLCETNADDHTQTHIQLLVPKCLGYIMYLCEELGCSSASQKGNASVTFTAVIVGRELAPDWQATRRLKSLRELWKEIEVAIHCCRVWMKETSCAWYTRVDEPWDKWAQPKENQTTSAAVSYTTHLQTSLARTRPIEAIDARKQYADVRWSIEPVSSQQQHQ